MARHRISADDRVACRHGCPIEVPEGAIGVVLSHGADNDLFIRWPDIGVQAWTDDEAARWLIVVVDE